jgi:hypothetical protein
MTPKELTTQIEERSLKAIERLNKIVISAQNSAYGRVVVVLKKLSLDADGYILQNAENRAIIREANRAFARALADSRYLEGLNRFTVAFSVIDEINGEYFKGFEGFNPNRQFIKSIQKQAIQDIEKQLLNDGLEAIIKQPLLQMLNRNINTGGSFVGMLEQVKDFIKGSPDTDGKLLRHVKTIVRDVLFDYNRTYQAAVSSDLNLEYYLYAGTIIDKTRSFCEEKVGKYYHHKEVEQWAGQDWKGKRSDTTESTIFIYLGGHNCLHQLIPVSEVIVPVEVLERTKPLRFKREPVPA